MVVALKSAVTIGAIAALQALGTLVSHSFLQGEEHPCGTPAIHQKRQSRALISLAAGPVLIAAIF
jgi:hypothetical protein